MCDPQLASIKATKTKAPLRILGLYSDCAMSAEIITLSSTAGALLPPNWIQEIKVTPGQRVSAISNDAGTFPLSITELTK